MKFWEFWVEPPDAAWKVYEIAAVVSNTMVHSWFKFGKVTVGDVPVGSVLIFPQSLDVAV
jgi:hypothetical protein